MNVHKKKLICELMGGIGNQLFILSTATALALKYNRDLIVVYKGVCHYTYHNDFRSTIFRNVPTIMDVPEDKADTLVIKDYTHKLINIDLANVTSDVRLDGYFQTAKYFDEYRTLILKNLYLTDNERALCDKVIHDLRVQSKGCSIIGMQVRRGDYIGLGWTLPITYYTESMGKFPNSLIVVTTDDQQWAINNIPNSVVLRDLPAYLQLIILSKLDGLIMSNSTFGWWIAYIGGLTNVIVPYPWFKGVSYNEDIYDIRWTKKAV